MNAAKLRLSEEEAALMKNANWILTKNRIMDNIRDWMTELQRQYQDQIRIHENPFPEKVLAQGYKISRGENFKGLPYMVLDFPRYFTKSDTLAIRSLFWWGRYFSCTLQLSGSYLEGFDFEKLSELHSKGEEKIYIGTGIDPWDHDLDSGGYQNLDSIDWQEIKKVALSIGYLKVVASFSLEEWEPAGLRFVEVYKLFVALLQSNSPGGETDLLPDDPREGSGL